MNHDQQDSDNKEITIQVMSPENDPHQSMFINTLSWSGRKRVRTIMVNLWEAKPAFSRHPNPV